MAFRDENEVRLLVEDHHSDGAARDLPDFDLSAIRKISLSPWLPTALEETVIEALRAAAQPNGGLRASIRRTSLLYNPTFTGAASEA